MGLLPTQGFTTDYDLQQRQPETASGREVSARLPREQLLVGDR